MENKIELSGINSVSRLVGNEYGQSVYQEQVAPKINLECKNVIVFPKHIEGVAISFIEGFIKMLPNGISRKDFYKYFSIEGKDTVKNKFFEVINMGCDK